MERVKAMYKIKPFLLQQVVEGYVIQNGISTTVITNENIINFLKECEKRRLKKLVYEDIYNYFGNLTTQVVNFLIENKIIAEVEDISNLQVGNVIVLSNVSEFLDVFKHVTRDMEKNIDFLHINEYKKVAEKKNIDTMCVLYMNPFSLEKYKEVITFIMGEGVMMKAAFYYDHAIYISNIYKKQWHTPCPQCFFYNLESQLRARNSAMNTLNFQTIIDMLYENNPRFQVEGIVTVRDLLNVIMLIIKDIFYKGDANDILQRVIEYRLEDGTINEDVAYHWELCDCYE